ncbi:MAG: response regulator [Chloroflexi bacterium]|nr:response regulator [Chloroflexota bacterium]
MNKPFTILYADDNPGNLQLVRLVLRDQNCRYLEAKDGQMAIDLTLREHPDLIFMDINMPIVNGLAATKHLKSLPEVAGTPIIALTSNTMPGDREACFTAGCDDYLIKPILRNDLLKTITRFRKSAAAASSAPVEPPVAEAKPAPQASAATPEDALKPTETKAAEGDSSSADTTEH